MTSAFCPGHISCVFQPRRVDDLLRSGSRGLGISISLGATAEVEEADSLICTVNGSGTDATVTAEALRIMGAEGLRADIMTDLPLSQGFAMSAAGTVAACLAYASLTGLSEGCAFQAAHRAEMLCGGGMGDVAGIMSGGVSMRLEEGLPPYGSASRLDLDGEILLAVLGPPLITAGVLNDREMCESIEAAGGRALEAFIPRPGWGTLFQVAREFASQTGLVGEEVAECIRRLEPYGEASMCMLGNSIFFRGDIEKALSVIDPSRSWVCKVDIEGPRLLG